MAHQPNLSSRQPTGSTLHLVSSLDETASRVASALGGPKDPILLIETARLAEGRAFAPGEALPFEDLGFDVRICDLKRETPGSLGIMLEPVSACVLLGGNSFALMQALDEVGFDAAIRRRICRGGPALHIVGESAGAVATGTSITHVATMDDPSVPTRRIDKGLSWIDARVLPHRGCPHWGFGEAVERVIAEDADPDSLLIIDETEMKTFAA